MVSLLAFFVARKRLHVGAMLRDRDFILLFAPIAAVISLWLLFPPSRFPEFLSFLINRPEGPPALSLEGLLYYPAQLYAYSGPLIVLYAAAALLSLKHLKNEKIRFLLIVVGITILLNFFHQNKKVRYILYIYPPLFALASFQLERLYARIRFRRKEIAFFAITGICVALFSFYMLGNIRLYDDYYSVDRPLDFIKNGTLEYGNIFVLGEFNEISPGLIAWNLNNATKQIAYSSYSSWEFEGSPGALVRTATGPDSEGMNRFLDRHGFDAIILIDVSNASIFYNNPDYLIYNKWKLGYIPVVLESGNYSMQNSRYFEDIDVEISILKRVST